MSNYPKRPGTDVATEIARAFGVGGNVSAFQPHVGGHIHRSFVMTAVSGAGAHRYFVQQINTSIFSDPSMVAANIAAVTGHLRQRIARRGDFDLARRVLLPRQALDGEWLHRTRDGTVWRVFDYIDCAVARGAVRNVRDAFDVGAAFGEFQALLADYAGPPLFEVLPGFHDTPSRLRAFDEAVRTNSAGRVGAAGPELAAVHRQRHLAPLLMELSSSRAAPTRIVHNDAKISNVLFDATDGARLCVVDLDIVMPGLSLFDFGDMVRSAATLSAEDEPDVTRVHFDMALFEAIVCGYWGAAAALLLPIERENLVISSLVITFEQSIRFLGDFLNGDCYYATERPNHNLHRARTQLTLLDQMFRCRDELERIVRLRCQNR